MPRNILDEICAHVAGVVEGRMREKPLASVMRDAEATATPRDFRGALIGREPVALIAEAKKASPSKGLLRAGFDAAGLAAVYAAAGASAVSVLTEERYFQGRPEYLAAVKAACPLPALRKDFILDPYQVYESRALEADALLLIVRALDDARLADLAALAAELGMAALVEVHDEAELDRALAAGASLIGVNNRNLDTFAVDLETTIRLAARVDDGVTLVGESGIHTRADVERLREAGVDAILVGESIVTSADPAAKIRELIGP